MIRSGLWHHQNFRRLWIGDTISQFGSMVTGLALPLLAILVLRASTFEVGLLEAFGTLAFLLVGLPAGALVDRMRRRWVLVANDVIRAVTLGSVPLAAAFGVLRIGQLYVVALVTGVSTVFFDVAWQSYLPEVIDRQDLVEGNARLTASQSVAQVAGPPVGGLLIQVFTAPYAVLVDALSFLWSAGWVATIHAPTARPPRVANRSLRREMAEGIRFVFGNPMLRAISTATSIANFFSSLVGAVFLILLARDLHLSAGLIGLFSSFAAVGGLIGSLVAGRVTQRFGQGPTIWLSLLVSAPVALVYPFAHRNWTLAFVAVAQFAFWFGAVVYNITQVSFRQGLCPPALLGRMNATIRFLVWGTMPLGAIAGGLLGSWLGVRQTLFVGAVGGVASFLPVFLSPMRRVRTLPGEPADE
jgi:MFS family permease